MIHLAQFSGGKDSTAMLLWLQEQGIEFTAVFCDTGWEHPLAYAYIEEINQSVLGGKLVRLSAPQGFEELVLARKMFPSRMIRFCTTKLKVEPCHRYIESLDDLATIYIGERADESQERSIKAKRDYVEDAGGYWIERPILGWTVVDVFDIAKRHGVAANPLYLMGASRVGCWPCINSNHRDVKAYLRMDGFRERLSVLESKMNADRTINDYRSFFPPRFIPDHACSATSIRESGRKVKVPTCDDVFRYLESVDENQLPLFEAPKCMSIYNLCE